METKTKTFDAIEMSRRLRRDVSSRSAGMSREEKLIFFNSVLPDGGGTSSGREEDGTRREKPPEK